MGRGSNEQAKGHAEWDAGVYVVLMRARGESGELYPELSTAASRWRPRAVLGAWQGEESASARATGGGGGAARRVGRFCKQEVAGLALHGGIGAAQRRRQEKQRGRLEVEEKGQVCNFQNFRDLTVNLQ